MKICLHNYSTLMDRPLPAAGQWAWYSTQYVHRAYRQNEHGCSHASPLNGCMAAGVRRSGCAQIHMAINA